MIGIIENHQLQRSQQRHKRRGQSFVEFALTMPVLLLIVAGVLEVGNLLTHYHRTVVAAREGARFGAAGGTDTGIRTVVEQAAQNSLRIDPAQMTVWVIRPVVETGTSPWSWENGDAGNPWGTDVDCVYGNNCGSLDLDPGVVMQDIIQVGTGPIYQTIDNKTIVVVVVRYDTDTVLNLNFWDTGADANGRVPIWSYSALVQEIDESTISQLSEGCSSYSLAIERDWLDGLVEGQRFGGTGSGFVINDLFDPARRDTWGITAWQLVPLDTMGPNYVHGQGIFCENPSGTGTVNGSLCASLWPPGTSTRSDLGFVEYDSSYPSTDPSVIDTSMHRKDWVLASTQSGTSTANQPLIDHEDSGRAIRIIVYDYEPGVNPRYVSFNGGPELWQYRIDDFAIIKVLSHSYPQDWIQGEFVRWDNSCGEEQ